MLPGDEIARGTAQVTPVTWLNLLCLDAPLVSVAWFALFSKIFHVPGNAVHGAALFLTAWVIYLADRLADSYSLESGVPASLRQEFCLRHRRIWIGALILIATVDAILVWQSLDSQIFRAGVALGLLALIYLAMNHFFGRLWRLLPFKEITIGFLFAAGTLILFLPGISLRDRPFLVAALGFAALCSLNCISIAAWERGLDEAQSKVSIATRFPIIGRLLIRLSLTLAAGSLLAALVWPEAAPVYGCIAGSALMLALLDFLREEIDPDQRTALADLVLLTPLFGLLS